MSDYDSPYYDEMEEARTEAAEYDGEETLRRPVARNLGIGPLVKPRDDIPGWKYSYELGRWIEVSRG